MAGRLPPTDASEAHVLGITTEGYLGMLDGQAITKEAYLAQAPIPMREPARKAQRAIVFLEAPEPTAAERLASQRAKQKAQGVELPPMPVPQVQETPTDEEEGPEEPRESAQELMDRYYAEEPDAS